MSRAVFCIAISQTQAELIVDQLRAAGFTATDISVLFPDKRGTQDFAHETHTKAPEGTTAGVGAGGLLGGTLGLLMGIGLLAIPGMGPLIAAGPLLAALSGAAVGAAVGGVTGGLIGMGIPEYEAKRYEGKIREGNILISVHATTHELVERASRICAQAGARDVSSSREAPISRPRGPLADRLSPREHHPAPMQRPQRDPAP